ncbi:blood vessel epicardial substance-like [Limulus polyphemus]|uniref:Blood vessel epicardial substance-like n=1 Tax=Limulus polyphemus TaxID=6850 RepID=A0ABM1BFV3_LIMPO|nr:blood vessel epicardial substance-like [Limulus polyphemus]
MNNSLNTTTRGRYCEEWEGARHGLFQLANLCFAGAFLVPPKLQMNVLLMRSTLTVGFLLVTLWAGVDICAPDIFAWNVTFLFTNLLHSLFLLYRNIPPRIQPQLLDLFHKIFVPLKVDKKSFMDLVKEAEVISIKPEEYYAIEGATAADERLAVLLSGKMKATFGNLLLHYIHPNEFLDSPEWESCTVDSDKLFQVSISAVEPSRFFFGHVGNLMLLSVITYSFVISCIILLVRISPTNSTCSTKSIV